ncbi:hypothetical protein MN608_01203 [Microdochium nivale]|nr:hypothetical protein MN608_01203 [Microdochium nivale]
MQDWRWGKHDVEQAWPSRLKQVEAAPGLACLAYVRSGSLTLGPSTPPQVHLGSCSDACPPPPAHRLLSATGSGFQIAPATTPRTPHLACTTKHRESPLSRPRCNKLVSEALATSVVSSQPS